MHSDSKIGNRREEGNTINIEPSNYRLLMDGMDTLEGAAGQDLENLLAILNLLIMMNQWAR